MDWRFNQEKDAIWRKVIATKYESSRFNQKLGSISLASSKEPWKSIDKLKHLVYNHISSTVGKWQDCYGRSFG